MNTKISTWGQIKPRFFEILLTALLSALIAFLQSLLANSVQAEIPTINPEVAGAYGAGIRGFFVAVKNNYL